MTDLVETIHGVLAAEVDPATPDADVLRRAGRAARAQQPLLAADQADVVARAVLARLRGLGVLDELLADDAVTEVMINGPGSVLVDRHGVIGPSGTVVTAEELDRLVERMVLPAGRRVDRSSPMVDTRLPDGSRVNVVVPPVAIDGPVVTIRRFRTRRITVADAAQPEVASYLLDAVAARRNIVVSGPTASGKTTLLNALAAGVHPGERLITVEDSAELRLDARHVVRLEARPANLEGAGEVTIRDLVRNALRMRPDRLIVGEVRGAEALDMVQALNTGHDGSLSTCHANSPVDACHRLETMVLYAASGLPVTAIRRQLASAIQLIVHLERRGDDRSVVEIDELIGVSADGIELRPVVRSGHLVDRALR